MTAVWVQVTSFLLPMLLIAGAVLTGCAGSAAAPRPTAVTAYAMAHPLIVPNPTHHPDSFYEPDPIRVKVGTTVTWTNQDTDPHDVTAVDGTFYSGPIPADGSWSWTFTKPGTYPYFCTIHPDMHGEIIVSP